MRPKQANKPWSGEDQKDKAADRRNKNRQRITGHYINICKELKLLVEINHEKDEQMAKWIPYTFMRVNAPEVVIEYMIKLYKENDEYYTGLIRDFPQITALLIEMIDERDVNTEQ